MENRRQFIWKILLLLSAMVFKPRAYAKAPQAPKKTGDIQCALYRAINGKPDENLIRVIEMLGGINEIVGSDDVVVIKPNVQWWNQGAPNLLSMKTFIDLIMNRSGGFSGEVVIAENCHRGNSPENSLGSGWKPVFARNSDLDNISNYNSLSAHLKKKYGNRFTTSHWIDVDAGAKRIYDPADGPGYVFCDGTGGVPLISFDNGCHGDKLREVIMTYPVFKTDNGTMVDFKNGIWENGSYTEQPLKFINFAALNHHSSYCGATSAVKNYLGISDLSGGADPNNGGKLTAKYYNFHSFPFNKWSPGPAPGMLGAEIGVFMNTIRKADLNITTAEWIGLSSRTEPPVANTKAVVACKDPVALDYHACKYLLYPNSSQPLHNPDDKKGPLHNYLLKCAEKSSLSFDEKHVEVKSYDFEKKAFQGDENLVVEGDITWWGSNIKSIIKYMVMRFM